MFDPVVFSQEFPKLKSITNKYMMKIRTKKGEKRKEQLFCK